MDLDLKGKSVVITGGGSNIGRAIVLGFAAEGADITIGDIDEKQAGDTAEFAKRAGAGQVQVVKTDVTDLAQVQAMVPDAAEVGGSVEALLPVPVGGPQPRRPSPQRCRPVEHRSK